jgi:hypothetical protein
MEGMDGCFDLAAVASVERGNLDWVSSHRTNITGTVTTARKADTPIPVVYARRQRSMGLWGGSGYTVRGYNTAAANSHARRLSVAE